MIRFVAFTDLHYDHIFDGDRRIDEILESIRTEKLDFLISLGDLCYPIENNKSLLKKLNSCNVPVYYVIGNHDFDHFTEKEVREFLNLSELNYAFQIDKTKFIILNSCYKMPTLPEVGVKWLEQEMKDKELSYVIFSHHSLTNNFMKRGIVNRIEVQKILSTRKTILCMNGHDHGDDCKIINHIPYFTLNSCAYIWHGGKSKYLYLEDLILYKEPLHCIVEISDSAIKIKGMQGDYLNITPEDVGIQNRIWNGISIEPRVSNFENKTVF